MGQANAWRCRDVASEAGVRASEPALSWVEAVDAFDPALPAAV
jgi:hypothetical protein